MPVQLITEHNDEIPEELFRIFVYLIISIIYISFWLGVAILFSILFRSTATSALAALAVWIFFSFFISIGTQFVAQALISDTSEGDPEQFFRSAKIVKALGGICPSARPK